MKENKKTQSEQKLKKIEIKESKFEKIMKLSDEETIARAIQDILARDRLL